MQQKQLAIAQSTFDTAMQIKESINGLPKRNKYWFKKSYRRGLSRQNKKKMNIALAHMAIQAAMGAMQIRMIIATPIPKFKTGGLF